MDGVGGVVPNVHIYNGVAAYVEIPENRQAFRAGGVRNIHRIPDMGVALVNRGASDAGGFGAYVESRVVFPAADIHFAHGNFSLRCI